MVLFVYMYCLIDWIRGWRFPTTALERVSDLGSPVHGSFKTIPAALVVPDRLTDLLLCRHDKWTWKTNTTLQIMTLLLLITLRMWHQGFHLFRGKCRTAFYHRLFDWFSCDEHEMRDFRSLRRKEEAVLPSLCVCEVDDSNFYVLWKIVESTLTEQAESQHKSVWKHMITEYITCNIILLHKIVF